MLEALLLVSGTEVFARLGGRRLVFPVSGSFWTASLSLVLDPTSRAATEGEAAGPHRFSLCEVPVSTARYLPRCSHSECNPLLLFLC